MLYLISRLLLITLLCSSKSLAQDTIIIKKYKKPSKAILNKKIVYMDMGKAPSKQTTNSRQLNSLASPRINTTAVSPAKSVKKSHQVAKLKSKNYGITKLKKKTRLSSLDKGLRKNFNRSSDDSQVDIGEYSEDDWGDFAEYQESWSVNAKIIK